MTAPNRTIRLGLRANLAQFHASDRGQCPRGWDVGPGTHGSPAARSKRSSVSQESPWRLTFIVAFGLVKAVTNFVAGTLVGSARPQADTRRRMAHRAPGAAAADLGTGLGLGRVRQRVTRRSTRVSLGQPPLIMKIDLAGPKQRGLGDGTQRSRRIYGRSSVTALGSLDTSPHRTGLATRTVLPGHRLCGAGSRIVDIRGS